MKKELELYIHIPFCKRKCAYCDFLSFPAGEDVQKRYVEKLIKEIKTWENRGDYQVSSVFVGGGTPSILAGEDIFRIMEAAYQSFSFEKDAEISIEANPGTVSGETLAWMKKAGINRLSFGLQSTFEEELKRLGRIHTYEEFLKNYSLARDIGFTNINVDLMSALPGQKVSDWETTLNRIAVLRPEHISAYSLIVEEGTPFYERYEEDVIRREKGETPLYLPGEEEERKMYEVTEELLSGYGYHRYEISNYAKEGMECRHNTGYWKRTEYKGFGLGAASLTEECRYSNTRDLKEYLTKNIVEQDKEALSIKEQMEETMFLGLRMMKGVSKQAFEETFGVAMEVVYGSVLERLKAQKLLNIRDGYVSLTRRGMDISNYVMSEFLLDDTW